MASIDWSKCLHPTSKHELVRLDVNYHNFVFNGEIYHVISEFSILFFVHVLPKDACFDQLKLIF